MKGALSQMWTSTDYGVGLGDCSRSWNGREKRRRVFLYVTVRTGGRRRTGLVDPK